MIRSAAHESDFEMARRCSSDPITPEIKLALTLRMCAGARWQDIRRVFKVSKPSIFRCFMRVIQAINHVEDISIRFDDDIYMANLTEGFERSSDGYFRGCVSVVDGYAVNVAKPRISDCANPLASYWNRKGFYSIVLQAGCDINRRFNFASMICAGSTHDSVAFELTQGRIFRKIAANKARLTRNSFWNSASVTSDANNSQFTRG